MFYVNMFNWPIKFTFMTNLTLIILIYCNNNKLLSVA